MQTFLPYRNFAKCAKVLDRQRLCKQRIEVYQILKALSNPDYGWQNHPAVKMWRGYEPALIMYGYAICREWIGRGYNDTCEMKITLFARKYPVGRKVEMPNWLTDSFCKSHQSNLIRKLPEHYQKLWPGVQSDIDYIWPVK
jgi:hypothetical protein